MTLCRSTICCPPGWSSSRPRARARPPCGPTPPGSRLFLRFLADEGLPAELTKANVIAFLASMAELPARHRTDPAGRGQAVRQLAGRRGRLRRHRRAVGEPPRLDQKAVAGLSDDELRRLLKACEGNDLRDKRDKAMVMLFAETGLRASELLGLTVGDLDLSTSTAHVVRGKGGKGRRVKFSASCAATLDRYLRARRAAGHPADRGPLWVSREGALGYSGPDLHAGPACRDRRDQNFHLHRFRHTMAVRWLKAGGSETVLMAQAGWRSRTMIDRYVKASSEALAAAEFDRLNLGIGLD